MVVRKMLDLMFSQHDLAWLDDILPDKDKKKKEDDKKKKKDKKPSEPESDEEVRKHTMTIILRVSEFGSECVTPSVVDVDPGFVFTN